MVLTSRKKEAPCRLCRPTSGPYLCDNVRQGKAGHAGIGHNGGVTTWVEEDGDGDESVEVVARLELDREASLLDNIEKLTAGRVVALGVTVARQRRDAQLEAVGVACPPLPMTASMVTRNITPSQVTHRGALAAEAGGDYLRHLLLWQLKSMGGP